MPATPLIYSSGAVLATAISGATEVVAATCSGVSMRYAGQRTTCIGHALVTTPGSTTGVVIQVRRASLTGTQIGDATNQAVTAAAATSNMYVVVATDTLSEIDGMTYVMTITCTAGSGAGSIVYGILDVRID